MTNSQKIPDHSIKGWRKACLLVLFAPPVILSCGLCAFFVWASVGIRLYQEFHIHPQFNVYPEAQRITEGRGYYGGGSGYREIYYWTDDSVEEVRQYYETFTLPFVNRFNREITVFHPFEEVLPVVTKQFGNETVDMAKERHCYYEMPYECVQIELFPADGEVSIRLPVGVRPYRTPTPLSNDLIGGTVIIYSYYYTDLS